MKTFGRICMMLTLVVGMIALSSCSKDDEENGSVDNPLNNTHWESADEDFFSTLDFKSSTFTYMLKPLYNNSVLRTEGIYTFDGTTIKFTFTAISGEGYTGKLTVEEANMNLTRTATYDGNIIHYSGDEFVKK